MLKKKVSSKVTATPEPEPIYVSGTDVIEEVKKIDKLMPFGNEDMHKLVAKLNEIIEHING